MVFVVTVGIHYLIVGQDQETFLPRFVLQIVFNLCKYASGVGYYNFICVKMTSQCIVIVKLQRPVGKIAKMNRVNGIRCHGLSHFTATHIVNSLLSQFQNHVKLNVRSCVRGVIPAKVFNIINSGVLDFVTINYSPVTVSVVICFPGVLLFPLIVAVSVPFFLMLAFKHVERENEPVIAVF